KECHTRVKQPLFCPTHNRIIERSEVVKGYEYEKDQYVLFTEEELDKIEPPSAKVAEILEFVKLGEVDPIYFDASYFLSPDEAGAAADREPCRPVRATEISRHVSRQCARADCGEAQGPGSD